MPERAGQYSGLFQKIAIQYKCGHHVSDIVGKLREIFARVTDRRECFDDRFCPASVSFILGRIPFPRLD
jgi:hypothetical protein